MRSSSCAFRFLGIVMALVASTGTASASIFGFGDFSGFSINKAAGDSGPSPQIFPAQDKIELTDNSGDENRTIFYNTPQPVSNFNASFIYQETNNNVAPNQIGTQGVTFVLQNTAEGAQAVGVLGGAMGFQGMGGLGQTKSAGISLELTQATGTALYTQGNVMLGGANLTSPVNLLSGDPILVTLNYNGSILHETLLDKTTSAQADFFYLINLPQLLGATNAYVGFAAQTPFASLGFTPDQQYISDFQFNAPEPSSVALLSFGAIGVLAHTWHRRRSTARSSQAVT